MSGHDERNGRYSSDTRHSLIPGGAHTYSRGDDQYPSNAPSLLKSGSGTRVFDLEGRSFIDWGMGLRSVVLGYAEPEVDRAVIDALVQGVNLSRPIELEFELAEIVRELVPCAEMVKFGKNGSDATAAAIRLARAVTGRSVVLRSSQDSFLGVHDWFIGSTVMNSGVPYPVRELTKKFEFNDIASVTTLMDEFDGEVAAIILEPTGAAVPEHNFLEQIRRLTAEKGIVLIFDETITGFRLSLGGAQEYFGITPDLATFGKALGNGYAISALTGAASIMDLGGIRHSSERVFLMSSTYGSERVGLAAAKSTIKIMQSTNALEGLRNSAETLMSGVKTLIERYGLGQLISVTGLDLLPNVSFHDADGIDGLLIKTLLMQEMVKRGVLLAPWFMSISAAHKTTEIEQTLEALDETLSWIAVNLERNLLENALIGARVAPVFRRFN
ncbi:glutamate-1-semialdehyde 2,1-aminomutase [Actinomycetota bacterium]|nr:glutamate-1-semialdehyde 2,1-aminomutase [Actinomycetota bacterium]